MGEREEARRCPLTGDWLNVRLDWGCGLPPSYITGADQARHEWDHGQHSRARVTRLPIPAPEVG